MRSVLTLAVLAGLCASPSFAATRSAPAAVRAEVRRQTEMVAQLAQASAPYAALIQEAEALADFDLKGVRKAEELLSNGTDADQVKAWIADWRPQAEARLADLQSHAAAAPPLPTALLAAFARLSPVSARQAHDIAGMPAASSKIVDDVATLTRTIEDELAKAVAHDPDSIRALAVSAIEGLNAEVGGETAYMKLSMSTGGERHPQTALSGSIVASNEASEALLDAMAAVLKGQTIDQKALAASVRGHCSQARTEARRIAPLAAAMRGQLAPLGSLSAAVQTRWYSAWDTYAESAQVEEAIAGQCDKIADQLDQGVSPAKAAQSADQLQALAARRVALVNARRAALSQSP